MRRYRFSAAPRNALIADLDDLIEHDEHLNPDRTDRIEAYKLARSELEAGAAEVRCRRTLYRAVPTMDADKYDVVEGTAAELIGQLNEYHADRVLQGEQEKQEKVRQYADARNAIENGADEVRVDHTVYRVVEG